MAEWKAGTRRRARSWWLLLGLVLVAPGVAAGQATTAVTGQFVVYWVDGFSDGGSHPAYRLRETESGRSLELIFGTPPADLRSGDRVVLHGVESPAGVLRVERYEPAGAVAGTPFAAASTPAPPSGEQRTAILLLNFLDATLTCTTAQIEDRLFAAADSVSHAYAETSSGRVWFGGKAFGPFLIKDRRSEHCDPFGWAARADLLAATSGIDLRFYPRRLYVVATNPSWSCGWGGISELGVTPSASVVEDYGRCGYDHVHAHELGHALGMSHAGIDPGDVGELADEYGDASDFMGGSYLPLSHTNAPHKFQMGWVSPEAAPIVDHNGRFPLRPLETPLDSPWWPAMLRIARPGSEAAYFVSFRRRIGFDANLDDVFSEHTSIHRWGNDEDGGRTALIRTLGDDDTFAGPGFVVSQLDRSPGGAFVEVAFSCEPFAPRLDASAPSPDGRSRLHVDLGIRNDDTALCPPSSFSVDAVGPPGWSVTASPPTLAIGAKARATATLQIEMPAGTPPGAYELTVAVAGAASTQHAQVVVPVPVSTLPGGGGGGGQPGDGGDGGSGGGDSEECTAASIAPLDRARCLTARLLADGPCAADGLRHTVAGRLRRDVETLDRLLGKIARASRRRAHVLAGRAARLANGLMRFVRRQSERRRIPATCANPTIATVNQLRPLLQGFGSGTAKSDRSGPAGSGG